MNSQRYKKKRRQSNLPALFAGLLIVGVAFIFSINVLSDSSKTEENTAQKNEQVSKEEFIDRISPHAQELQSSYGVLPSIIIGQGILESNWGQSTLASKYNNLFGIKAYGDQKKVNLETKEYINEEWIVIQGDFRVYDTWEESMDDHTRLFVNGVTWNPRLYENVLLAKNYKEAAQALQDAGYATDPTYAEKVIHVIESYDLNKYDH
ncbi:glycoside hydrolase family 73 protein [Enterococcus sp. DIV0242_7C1]|uniref:N-acetylmuramoyl-L-alanine amidase n=1 Tax=Candidatus Enterococcus dunnyi TaxID=1834192 RepID=A0A200JEW3_9ENTE|nr:MULTISPECIES: glycoside hydrolase family 73 protein [unclassified Enterococcus]MBO0469001.1 glycoside hydrolase family 73 protein [Enterococcus sp. DIV0242_7C1]MCA5012587.1 glycoside hydrolase family 73 protein [Enterococcus sp. S23]MCA5015838.1 glycoside hydrolase family 73 protein [Enterococcus sp. S22(2020)]OUZ35706.1 N-acetylmuramoyl-L-alanine amidase [Enterococcus sp. 9D6_DIV0238]